MTVGVEDLKIVVVVEIGLGKIEWVDVEVLGDDVEVGVFSTSSAHWLGVRSQ